MDNLLIENLREKYGKNWIKIYHMLKMQETFEHENQLEIFNDSFYYIYKTEQNYLNDHQYLKGLYKVYLFSFIKIINIRAYQSSLDCYKFFNKYLELNDIPNIDNYNTLEQKIINLSNDREGFIKVLAFVSPNDYQTIREMQEEIEEIKDFYKNSGCLTIVIFILIPVFMFF